MTLRGPEFNKAMLLGSVAAVVPLFYYPFAFGWQGSLSGAIWLLPLEVAYYMAVLFAFWRRKEPSLILRAALITLAFRLAMGLVSGLLVAGFHGLPLWQAIAVGLYRYLPGVLLHAAIAPFLLRPAFRLMQPRRTAPEPLPRVIGPDDKVTAHPAASPAWAQSRESVPDFDAAMGHVAAYPSVELALLVDHEGLPVAKVSRGGADCELWSPVVNLIDAAVRRELARTPDADVHRLQLDLTHRRLVVERIGALYLAVLFDRATDELVNVRIAQAVEMVKRYVEHRYHKVAPADATGVATEVAYV